MLTYLRYEEVVLQSRFLNFQSAGDSETGMAFNSADLAEEKSGTQPANRRETLRGKWSLAIQHSSFPVCTMRSFLRPNT